MSHDTDSERLIRIEERLKAVLERMVSGDNAVVQRVVFLEERHEALAMEVATLRGAQEAQVATLAGYREDALLMAQGMREEMASLGHELRGQVTESGGELRSAFRDRISDLQEEVTEGFNSLRTTKAEQDGFLSGMSTVWKFALGGLGFVVLLANFTSAYAALTG